MNARSAGCDRVFRAAVRGHFDARIPPEMRAASELMTSVYAKREVMDHWQRVLHEKGWGAPAWPLEYGGQDWSPSQHHIFAEEKARAGAPPFLSLSVIMCGAVIIAFGTVEQKARFLPPMISGEHYWCQGYSEPSAGSDLSALGMRAEEDGDDLVCNGSKIWTSHAHEADWMYALVRNASGPRAQDGITFLLIDMRTPGIAVQPIVFLTGEHIQNEVVFCDVRVPRANVVGGIGSGWAVAKYLMEFERGAQPRAPDYAIWLDKVASLAKNDETLASKIATAYVDLRALEALEWKSLHAAGSPSLASSALKILSAELSQRIAELALEAQGYATLPYQPEWTAPGGNTPWAKERGKQPVAAPFAAAAMLRYFNSRAASIYAGSNEI